MSRPSFRQPGPLGIRHSSADSVTGEMRSGRATPASPKKRTKLPAFKNIPRDELVRTVEERKRNASLISQRGTSLCGAASLMFLTAQHKSGQYADFVTDLYENGKARLGELEITPGQGCKDFNPAGKIAAADWVALASIRDSENVILDYDDPSDEAAGITIPSTLASWLEKSGFQSVINNTNLYLTKGEEDLKSADQLKRSGYKVCLFVNADGLSKTPSVRNSVFQMATIPNHWIVLTSNITIDKESVKFTVFSWGRGDRPVPFVPMKESSLEMWLQNFYGYVACKP